MRSITPVVKNLIIINLILFGIGELRLFDMVGKLGLFYFGNSSFQPLQIFTSFFLHANLQHIIFNMFSLYSIGTILEQTWGGKRFLNFYLACGVGSSVFHLIVMAIIAYSNLGHFIIDATDFANGYEFFGGVSVGASGAILGVFTAIAILYPNLEFMLFLIPFPIKAKYLFIFFVIVDIYLGGMNYSWDNTGHFAHLGGVITGYILTKMNKNARFNRYWK
jgi:membrane associated rhomboid family serine protease